MRMNGLESSSRWLWLGWALLGACDDAPQAPDGGAGTGGSVVTAAVGGAGGAGSEETPLEASDGSAGSAGADSEGASGQTPAATAEPGAGGAGADAPSAGGAGADAPSTGGSAGEPAAASGGAGAAPTPPPALDPNSPSYEVPVTDSTLRAFAQYPVGVVEWTAKKGERKLEYALPTDLIGSEQRLELVGADNPNGPWTLRGATFGTADCQVESGQIVCREALAGVPIDVNAVSARVQAGALPPQRLEVTKVFNGDPIGILRFPRP
jgi:hypothetical protein